MIDTIRSCRIAVKAAVDYWIDEGELTWREIKFILEEVQAEYDDIEASWNEDDEDEDEDDWELEEEDA